MAQNTNRIVVSDGEFIDQSTITHVNFREYCVGVGDQSFKNCSELSEINDNNVIETIGSGAFAHTGLKSAKFPNVKTIGNNAFEGCKKLTSIGINNDCSFIGDGAFKFCECLTDVTIPNNENFKTINKETFFTCSSLSKIIIPDNVITIGDGAFKQCGKLTDVTIGKNVTTIGGGAFNLCSTLTTISIPDSVETIGADVFKQCYSITSVKIGTNVSSIGDGAFSECSSLTDVELNCETVGSWFSQNGTIKRIGIGDNVKTIGNNAFAQCSNITTTKIGKSVTNIGDGAFSGCSSLTDVTYITNDGSNNSSITNIGKNAFEKCSKLTWVQIPDSVETIGGGAFNNCTNLSGIYIGVNVSSIGADAFSGCSNIEGVYTNNLKKWCNINFENSNANPVTNSKNKDLFINNEKIKYLEIPDGVETIKNYAFYNCKNIKTITIPNSLKTIESEAFYGSNESNIDNYNGCKNHVIINYSDSFKNMKEKDDDPEYGYIAKYAHAVIAAAANYGPFIFDWNGKLVQYVESYDKNVKIDLIFPNEATFQTGEKIQDYVVDSKLFKIMREGKCDDITSVTILENSAEEFENNVFDGCTNLSELIINYSDTPLKLGYKYHNTEIDENGKPQTGEGLFYDCQNIKNITLNRNLDYDAYAKKEYGYSPFSGIKSNFDVEIGDNVTKIGNLLFYYSDINNIKIGENVEEIGGSAFEVCHKLNGNIVIPNSVKKIGACAFYNCANLTNVTLPKNDNFKTISERLFYHCYNLKDVTIPDSVKTIEDYAFENCKNIEKVYIPDSVTKIGENSFYNCSGIKYITIGQGIGDNSFGEDSENSNSFRSVKEDGKDIIKKHEVINFSQIKLPDEKGIIDGEEVYISTKYGYVVYGASYLLNAINGSQEGDFIFGKKEESDENFSLLRYLRDNDEVLDDIPVKYSPKENVEYIYRIDDGVFAGHTEIKEITIPGGVYEIGNDVFNGCENLTEMCIEDCDEALSLGHISYNQDDNDHNEPKKLGLLYDTKIEKFYLGRDITYDIDDGKNNDNPYKSYSPLYNKTSLKKVKIGDHVTEINKNLFWGCINIGKLNEDGEDGELTIGNNVKSIGENSFRNCKNLKQVSIPNSVETIGNSAFYGCSGMYEVVIPNTIKKINQDTFNSCHALTYVSIPDSVTSIGRDAFNGCSGLTSVTIGDSVTSIENSAFMHCNAIENVYIKDLYNWCKIDFKHESSTPMSSYVFVEPNLYENLNLVEDLVIPEGITEIKNYTFLGCHSLKTVTTHSGVESIGNYAFEYCKYIENVTINNVKTIGEYAFKGCENLNNVTICGKDDGFTINKDAFNGCKNLTSISLNNTNTIGEDAFKGCENIKNVYITDLSNWCKINFKNEEKGDNETNPAYSAPMWSGENEEQNTCLYLKNTEVKDLVIPEGIIDIKNYTLVKELEIPEGITEIKDYTFFGCHSLEKVTIPSFVTFIHDEAFKFCYNLKTVINYSELEITKGKTEHGYVGYYANRLINAPNGKLFENGFFFGTKEGCDYLCGYIGSDTKVVLPEKSPFGGDKYVISSNVFSDYNDIVSVKIPNKVFGIGENAFGGCTRLTNITIPKSVEYVDSNAFNKCSCLTSVTIGNGCTYIGETAFGECCNLKRLVLGKNVGTSEEINPAIIDCEFELLIHFCPSYSNMPLPKENTKIIDYSSKTVEEKDNWMYSCGIFTQNDNSIVNGTKLCCYMGDESELIIPNLQKDNYEYYIIGEYSFAYMNNITSITITKDVDKIDSYAFKDCIGLKRIVIENNDGILIDNSVSYGCKNYILIDFCYNENKGHFGDYVECVCEPGGFIVDDFIFNSDDKNIKIYIGNDSELKLPELQSGYILDNNFHYIDGIDNYNGDGYDKNYICTSIKISDSVTSISDVAFENFKNLTKIEIGKGVTSIGNDIFKEIYKLNEIIIDKENNYYDSRNECNAIIEKATNTLIYGCNATKIPDGVEKIGKNAFEYTQDLKSITIPKSVTFIGDYAFCGCYFIKANFINNSGLENSENWGATIVDEETDEGLLIKDHTVIGCRSWATKVTIPNNVKKIDKMAFSECGGLTSITIPNSVTEIGEYAFYNIKSLKTVTINERENILSIGDYAFMNCIGINEITIPANTIKDDKAPFYGCIFANNNKFVNNSGKNMFYWIGSEDNGYSTREETDEGLLIINNTVISCRPWATEVTIPNTVTSISESAFINCSDLTSVTIPNTVTSIGDKAFYWCNKLTSVTLINNDENGSIGISGENSKTIGIGAFTHVSNNFKIYVPKELITNYINNSEWRYYSEYIEGYDIK